jgi:hypothetical protein
MCDLDHLRDDHQDLQNHILRHCEVFVNQVEHNPKTLSIQKLMCRPICVKASSVHEGPLLETSK